MKTGVVNPCQIKKPSTRTLRLLKAMMPGWLCCGDMHLWMLGTFAFEDPNTGWGDWTNETYTIYPDMVGVREDILLSNAPNAAHEWQESMMVLAPGQRPSDVLNYDALSLANIKGEAETYSWEHETPPHLPALS